MLVEAKAKLIKLCVKYWVKHPYIYDLKCASLFSAANQYSEISWNFSKILNTVRILSIYKITKQNYHWKHF